MLAFAARRIAALIPVLCVVGAIVFVLIHLTPGDPASIIAGPQATPEQVAALREQLGLNAPLWQQFLRWFGAALAGDLGYSLYFHEPVTATLWSHAGPTLSLTTLAFSLALLLAVPSGIVAAVYAQTSIDRTLMSVALLGISIPSFWLALMLIISLAVQLRWFPVAGYAPLSQGVWPWLHALLLPAFVLAVGQAGIIARMLRDGMCEALREPYVVTARSKGVPERRVVLAHVLPNAVLPTLTTVGTTLAALLGGAVVTETVFTIPGIGQLVVDSIARRDYPVIQGVVLCVAVMYVLVNLLVDLSYALLDPRIRYE